MNICAPVLQRLILRRAPEAPVGEAAVVAVPAAEEEVVADGPIPEEADGSKKINSFMER